MNVLWMIVYSQARTAGRLASVLQPSARVNRAGWQPMFFGPPRRSNGQTSGSASIAGATGVCKSRHAAKAAANRVITNAFFEVDHGASSSADIEFMVQYSILENARYHGAASSSIDRQQMFPVPRGCCLPASEQIQAPPASIDSATPVDRVCNR